MWVMVTVWWSSASLIHYSFLNPGKIKLMRCTKNCNCSRHLSTDWTQFFPMTMLVAQSTLQKLNELGYQVLPLLPYSPDFSPNDNSLQAKCSHNQEEAEKAFKVFVESQSMDFYATGISKLISHWQKCVDCNHSYFD